MTGPNNILILQVGGQELIPGTNFHLDFQARLMGGSKELLILEVLAGMMVMTSGSIKMIWIGSQNLFASITSFMGSDIETARVFAHELGHTIGMR